MFGRLYSFKIGDRVRLQFHIRHLFPDESFIDYWSLIHTPIWNTSLRGNRASPTFDFKIKRTKAAKLGFVWGPIIPATYGQEFLNDAEQEWRRKLRLDWSSRHSVNIDRPNLWLTRERRRVTPAVRTSNPTLPMSNHVNIGNPSIQQRIHR